MHERTKETKVTEQADEVMIVAGRWRGIGPTVTKRRARDGAAMDCASLRRL